MRTESKPVYVADDGTEFEDEAKCIEYEAHQSVEGQVDEFLATTEWSDRTKTTARKILLDYVAYCAMKEAQVELPLSTGESKERPKNDGVSKDKAA